MMSGPSLNFISPQSARIVRLLLARAYLHEYRVADAIGVYVGLARDDPEEVDARVALGTLYRLAGDLPAAAGLYRRALALCPGHPVAGEQLRQVSEPPALTSPEARNTPAGESALEDGPVAALAARLEAIQDPALRQAVRTAADPLTQAPEQMPAGLQRLMPALIEQNIRQARARGMPELADALQSLRISLMRQSGGRWHEAPGGEPPGEA
jgi:tetratricopeptide (TPR) repeat protein